MLALGAEQESVEPAVLAHGSKPRAATREHLMDVALMADVEEDPVRRRVEDTVKGDRQFDDTEVGTEMAPRLGEGADEFFADLLG